jgi:hypothetical protein
MTVAITLDWSDVAFLMIHAGPCASTANPLDRLAVPINCMNNDEPRTTRFREYWGHYINTPSALGKSKGNDTLAPVAVT